MMSKSGWAKLKVGGGLFLGVAAVLVGVPAGAEWYLDRRMVQAVEGRGIEAQWESVDWWWGNSVEVRGLQVAVRGGGRASIDGVTVSVEAPALLRGAVKLQRVVLDGVQGTLDLESEWVRRLKDGGAEAGDGVQGDAAEGATGGVGRRLASLRSLKVDDGTVVVERGGRAMGEVSGNLRWLRNQRGPDELDADGRLSVGMVAGGLERAWTFRGTVEPDERHLKGEVAFEQPLSVPAGPLRVSLAGMGLQVEGGAGRATLREVAARTSDEERSALAVELPELAVVREAGGPVRLETDGFSVSSTPARLSSLVGRVGGDGSAKAVGAGSRSGTTAGGYGAFLRRLAVRALDGVDLRATGGTVKMHFRRDDAWQVVSLGESVAASKEGRELDVRGGFGGGRFVLSAGWAAGALMPRRVAVEAEGVDLEEVPVLREGRRLPNRGVRGRVGGRVDMTALLVDSGRLGALSRRVSGMLNLSWQDGWVEAGGLAPEPVRGIDLEVETGLEWTPEYARVELMDTHVGYGPIAAAISGELVDWPLDPRLSFEAEVEELACQKAVRAVPAALLGPYDDVEIDGDVAPRLRFDFPMANPRKLSFRLRGFPGECEVVALHADKGGWPEVGFREEAERRRKEQREIEGLELFDLGGESSFGPSEEMSSEDSAPGRLSSEESSEEPVKERAEEPAKTEPDPRPPELQREKARTLAPIPRDWSPRRPDDVFWLRKPFVMRVTEGVSEEAEVYVGPGLDSYVELGEMPAWVGASAYLSEEINFYTDGGWNTHLIQKAMRLNFSEERFVYGGSTVTQQLVKNLFLTRDKTLSRKIREAVIAWRMQGVVSKDRVLELYLNCIEFGNDLYGIGPAAKHYFGKPASELGVMEAVFLATIKPAPWYGDRFLKRGKTPDEGWWPERMGIIVERLHDKGFITKAQAEAARPYVLEFPEARQEAAERADR